MTAVKKTKTKSLAKKPGKRRTSKAVVAPVKTDCTCYTLYESGINVPCPQHGYVPCKDDTLPKTVKKLSIYDKLINFFRK